MNDIKKQLRGKTNVVCRKKGEELCARKNEGDILWEVRVIRDKHARTKKLLNRDLAKLIDQGKYATRQIS